MKEETLSDKIQQGLIKRVLWSEDVKDFIKKLKEELPNMAIEIKSYHQIQALIDKLAGKELIE